MDGAGACKLSHVGLWQENMARILVVEDDKGVQDLVRVALEMQGHEVVVSETGSEAVEAALRVAPNLVILDLVLPEMDGFEVCRRLRSCARTKHVPIIMLSGRSEISDKLSGLGLGADDYVTKPFSIDELLARVHSQLRRVELGLLSQLTGLPGVAQVEEAIKDLVKLHDRKWAVIYFDIDRFKEYNDAYGFLKGNELIRATGRVIERVVSEMGDKEPFELVGHIGGDDFVVITSASRAEAICQEILRRFDRLVPEYYAPADRERGYIVTTDRQGNTIKAPIATLSAGIVTNRYKTIDNQWLLGSLAAEVKRKAKALPGSSYYVDQRR